MAKKSFLIVGNGMAAGRLLDELLTKGISSYNITVIGDESQGSYNRIMLSSVLANEVSMNEVIHKGKQWYIDQGIHFYHGFVSVIGREQQSVTCSDGSHFDYDELVLATGARSAKIPAKNQELNGVQAFRSIDDTESIINHAGVAEHALVIGGGLLGLEAAYGLAKRGMKVTLVHRSGWILNRQLDVTASALLQQKMEALGIGFRLNTEVTHFLGEKNVIGAQLNSGEELNCQLVIIATGISPNAELGLKAGLSGSRAVAVDDYMQTSDSKISALGEGVEHNGETFGLVAPIWEQAKALASRLTNTGAYTFKNAPVATKLKVSGVQVFSAGEIDNESLRALVIYDKKASIYRKILLDDGFIKGIVLFGDVSSGPFYFDLMQSGIQVNSMLPELVLGQTFIDQEDDQLLENVA